jgi:hypothetical protein
VSNEKSDQVDGAAAAATLVDLLSRIRRNVELSIRVMVPARVIVYDPALQKVSVTVEHLPVKEDETTGVDVPQPPIILPPIPVSFTRGMGGSAYQTVPILPGDTGCVVFSDRDLTTWLQSPEPGPVDPISGAAHALASGVFVPGMHQDTDPITPTAALDAHVIEGPLVRLGAAGVDFALHGTSINAELVTPRSVLQATPVSASPDPATVTAVAANKTAILAIIDALAANMSTKVQVE